MKWKIALAALAVATLGSSASADWLVTPPQVGWTRVSGYFDGVGGEFSIKTAVDSTNSPSPLVNTSYSALTKDKAGAGFQTFCLEYDEHIINNETMQVIVSTTNVDAIGSVTGPGSHADMGGSNTNGGDNLDPKTAYLYTHFAKGDLVGYNYTPGSGRTASADALQRAIWYIEGEISASSMTTDAWKFYNLAVDAHWSNIAHVRVLNMYTGPNLKIEPDVNGLYKITGWDYRQDQLYLNDSFITSEAPSPAAAGGVLALLGFVGLARRRRS